MILAFHPPLKPARTACPAQPDPPEEHRMPEAFGLSRAKAWKLSERSALQWLQNLPDLRMSMLERLAQY